MSKQLKLNKEWEAFVEPLNDYKDSYQTAYIAGASQFLNSAIKELTKQLNETSDIGDYNQGIRRGLLRVIINIKNIKP